MIRFKSDPDKWKSLSKAEIWAEIQRDWPRVCEDMKEFKRLGMSLERPRCLKR